MTSSIDVCVDLRVCHLDALVLVLAAQWQLLLCRVRMQATCLAATNTCGEFVNVSYAVGIYAFYFGIQLATSNMVTIAHIIASGLWGQWRSSTSPVFGSPLRSANKKEPSALYPVGFKIQTGHNGNHRGHASARTPMNIKSPCSVPTTYHHVDVFVRCWMR